MHPHSHIWSTHTCIPIAMQGLHTLASLKPFRAYTHLPSTFSYKACTNLPASFSSSPTMLALTWNGSSADLYLAKRQPVPRGGAAAKLTAQRVAVGRGVLDLDGNYPPGDHCRRSVVVHTLDLGCTRWVHSWEGRGEANRIH